ncbi:MAG: helix-turn-helix domain-containing protein [Oscillospiraceae bacterium]
MLTNKEIGERIKQRRKQLGFSLQEVATGIDNSRSTMSRYETGAVAKLSTPTLRAIADFLKVDVDYLQGKTDLATPPEKYKTSNDINDIIAAAKNQLMRQDALMFDGKPASDEAVQSILDAIEIGLSIAHKKNADPSVDRVKKIREEL